jgi:serine/threonine-protein kinase
VVSASSNEELGRVVAGRFALQRQLGAGAMGTVFEATPVGGGGPVAVKLLHRHLLAHPQALKRFRREARAAASLAHPNCVVVLEADTDASTGDPYLVMELLRGRTLADELREVFPVPLPRAQWITLQILAAIEAAHRQGIVHRDLKPANVMLVPQALGGDLVKVCDFGIAKLMDPEGGAHPLGEGSSSGTAQVLVGTPEYMSPEQARGDELDGRSDVYAAGVILYQMLSGDVPFRAGSAVGTLARKLAEPPPAPSEKFPGLRLPAPLEALIVRALQRNREDRPPSAAAFARELEAMTFTDAEIRAASETALESSGKSTQAPTLVGRTASRTPTPKPAVASTRGRRAWWLAVLAAGAAGALAIGLLRGRARPEPAPVTPTAAPAAVLASPSPSPPPPSPPAGPSNAAPDTRTVEPPADRRRRHPRAMAPAMPATAEPAPPPPAPAPSRVPLARSLLTEADALMVDGQVSKACATAERAKNEAPNEAAIYKFLGQCYMRLGKTRDAKLDYSRYLDLKPDAPDAGFIRGILK